MSSLDELCLAARDAARLLACSSSRQRDGALSAGAAALWRDAWKILEANRRDVAAAEAARLSAAMIERLTLNDRRVEDMARGLEAVAALPDPLGGGTEAFRTPDGLEIQKIRVPLGVVAMIYESRPNVTADAAAMCVKSGNAAVLRGGSEAAHSNRQIAESLTGAFGAAGLPAGSVSLYVEPGREAARALLARSDFDLLIPRGGKNLKEEVRNLARSPYVMTGMGLCHLYLDASADCRMAVDIAVNAKTQRPSTCNSIETLLIHKDALTRLLPPVASALRERGVRLLGDERARSVVPMDQATEEDWETEYLDLVLSIKTVDSLDDALDHISRYGSGHSEAIVTESYEASQRFLRQVDAAAVYVNASTRFTDGGVFGLGGEMGISTQKLHARGPLGILQLTSTKYIVRGEGQVRS